MQPDFPTREPSTNRPSAHYSGFIKRPESDNPEGYVYIPKTPPYFPRFDVKKRLPQAIKPTLNYMAQLGLRALPTAIPIPELVNWLLERTSAIRRMFIPTKLQKPGAPDSIRLQDWMPANKTRLRPDRDSDEYFVDRRLNGFNPGKLNRAPEGRPWQYQVRYETGRYKPKPGAFLPEYCEARFIYRDRQLFPHSIEYSVKPEINGKTSSREDIVEVKPDQGEAWITAKYIFRGCEYVFQEIQSHLGRTHMNMDQYAMAFYRNIVKNPIWQLLSPHFEGLLSIDQRGASLIIGDTGFIPEASALDNDSVTDVLIKELEELDYRWNPRGQWLEDDVANDYFKRSSQAMWELLTLYVEEFFDANQLRIKDHWSEVQGMSEDLVQHSIAKERNNLEIHDIQHLKLLCVYVIYHCSFLHSWVNNKQYEDGGDVEYASIGMWNEKSAHYNVKDVYKRRNKQVQLMWTLANVHYNPIIEYGSDRLKALIWEYRDRLEPGIPIGWIMMSINI